VTELLPRGAFLPVAGGVLIGVGIGVIYAVTGRIAGISSFLTAVQSRWSRHPYFHRGAARDDLRWKSVLVAGLVGGAALAAWLGGGSYVSTIQPWRLAAGGLLVGFGTRLGCGCTSGHGVCGLAAGARPSLAGTVAFVGTAMVVARLVKAAGVTP
jgi:uncharacterized membrane protein YedE/YeeE